MVLQSSGADMFESPQVPPRETSGHGNAVSIAGESVTEDRQGDMCHLTYNANRTPLRFSAALIPK